MPLLALLGNKWVLVGLAVAAAGVGLLWFYYDAKAAGAAAAMAAAAAEAARRVAAANTARSKVRPDNEEDMKNDSFNRSRDR